MTITNEVKSQSTIRKDAKVLQCGQNARRDGENMAVCLKTMTSGMTVFTKAFERLEMRYYPGWYSEFKRSFHGGIRNDSI